MNFLRYFLITALLLPAAAFGQNDSFVFSVKIDSVVGHYYTSQSNLWYFAKLYQQVSKGVDNYTANGQFEDAGYVKNIEKVFGQLYISALDSFSNGKEHARCWQAAFDTASCKDYGFAQTLLLSINAHAYNDLYFGLYEIFKQHPPQEKHFRDFDRVSSIHEKVAFAFLKNMLDGMKYLSPLEKTMLLKGVKKAKRELRRQRLKIWKMAEKASKSEKKHSRYSRKIQRKSKRYMRVIKKPKGLMKAGLSIASYFNGCTFNDKCKLLEIK